MKAIYQLTFSYCRTPIGITKGNRKFNFGSSTVQNLSHEIAKRYEMIQRGSVPVLLEMKIG